MKRVTVELIPDKERGGFTARVPDIPAYGEGETEREAVADLKHALRAYVAEFGIRDTIERIIQPIRLKQFAVNFKSFSRV